MDIQIQWFGLLVTLSSFMGLTAAGVLFGLALGRVRRVDPTAGLLLAAAAAIEASTLLGYVAAMVLGSGLRGDAIDLLLLLQNAFAVARPLLHAVALALVAVSCVRLTRPRT